MGEEITQGVTQAAAGFYTIEFLRPHSFYSIKVSFLVLSTTWLPCLIILATYTSYNEHESASEWEQERGERVLCNVILRREKSAKQGVSLAWLKLRTSVNFTVIILSPAKLAQNFLAVQLLPLFWWICFVACLCGWVVCHVSRLYIWFLKKCHGLQLFWYCCRE